MKNSGHNLKLHIALIPGWTKQSQTSTPNCARTGKRRKGADIDLEHTLSNLLPVQDYVWLYNVVVMTRISHWLVVNVNEGKYTQ